MTDESGVNITDRDTFISELQAHCLEKIDLEQRQGFIDFVCLHFNHYALSDLQGRSWQDLAGLTLMLWQFISPDAHLPIIRAFNPSKKVHGWYCPHTVLMVHQRDMPFLVDSVRIELAARNIPIYSIKSTPFHGTRHSGKLVGVDAIEHRSHNAEDVIYLEIGQVGSLPILRDIEQSLAEVMAQVTNVIQSYPALLERANCVAEMLYLACKKNVTHSVLPAQEFVKWLTEDHFTFLAYAEFDLVERNGQQVLLENKSQRLGLFDDASKTKTKTLDDKAHPGASRFYLSTNVVAFSKSPQRARVHRNAYPDYVVIKRFDSDGKVCGEARFLGLYTSSVYTVSPSKIPLLQDKVDEIYKRMGLNNWSHEGKALEQIIETYPRDELFQASAAQLYETLNGILTINERYQVRLFMRRDRFGKFVSCLLYVPRDLFSTQVRQKIQAHIGAAVGSSDQEFNTFFSESVLARVHMVFRIDGVGNKNVSVQMLESEVAEMVRSWEHKLYFALQRSYGEEQSRELINSYRGCFSHAYQEFYSAYEVVEDIQSLSELAAHDIVMEVFPDPELPQRVRLKIFHAHTPLALSDVIPMLENMGLRVVSEHPFKIAASGNDEIWLHDFSLLSKLGGTIDVVAVKDLFKSAFLTIWQDRVDNDAFNKLTLAAQLGWRQVNMLRTYACYMRQTLFTYPHDYIAQTLINQAPIACMICRYFAKKFDPQQTKHALEAIDNEIQQALETVPNLSEDRIIRHFWHLIKATVRCNYYDNSDACYLALKLQPQQLEDIPEPKPLFEIFIYSVRFEGLHLRGAKVARGGLRWSDRLQDYRTEVLGLVKAQQVKNAVIVPSGAKGGFVCKKADGLSREDRAKEGLACYQLFISALLDLTDNLVDGKLVPPANMLRYDEDDPYLVVAADKGTATFSDTANAIAKQYNFWLGDAFASGGSQGYDHKAMGITARGAWVSVRRHFKELGLDTQTEPFSVVGVGDMAGDVFGNGMLSSSKIQLVAAFNHLHIFIDPNPDTDTSFAERQRLFNTPRSNWADYNHELISAGGGVFERSAKSIAMSAEMRERFAISADKLSPNDLINALLKAPVDLFWNGGIGTYIKARSESHNDVGDKANDSLRVSADELRCKVIGEGGNLGVTQLARIEFSRLGGACNSDFIDNAAGVDCSDHEVNIKILLSDLIKSGELSAEARNQLLVEMTEAVAESVLDDNYRQTQAISIAVSDAEARGAEYRRFINSLENAGRLNRRLEFLPDDETLVERQAAGCGLTRPELAVLVSYAKVGLKEDLAVSEISDDDSIASICQRGFPAVLAERYPEALKNHRLRREIIATQLANEIVNLQGCTFVQRMQDAAGVNPVIVARAYVAASRVNNLHEYWQQLEALDFTVSAATQLQLMKQLMRRTRRMTRWFVRNRRVQMDIAHETKTFTQPLALIHSHLPELLSETACQQWQEKIASFVAQGVSEPLARAVVSPGYLYSGLGMVDVAAKAECEPVIVARLYCHIVASLGLDSFAVQLSEAQVDTYWQAMAREAYMDDLESQVRNITRSLIGYVKADDDVARVVNAWLEQHAILINRWQTVVTQAQSASGSDYAMFAVALRELLDLAQVSQYAELTC